VWVLIAAAPGPYRGSLEGLVARAPQFPRAETAFRPPNCTLALRGYVRAPGRRSARERAEARARRGGVPRDAWAMAIPSAGYLRRRRPAAAPTEAEAVHHAPSTTRREESGGRAAWRAVPA